MVEAKDEHESQRRSGKLFIYFAIMQVLVIVSTIAAVNRITDSQNKELGQLHSKLDQIFNEREERERLSRETALNASMMASSRPIQDLLPPLPLRHEAPSLPAQNAMSASMPGQPAVVSPEMRQASIAALGADKLPQQVAPGMEAQGLDDYDKTWFKEVVSVEGQGTSSEWDDGYDEMMSNCSKSLKMPDGGPLKRVLLRSVEPLKDAHVWLLNVGAGTTGTRTVQREICKRQIKSTHWHWHCNLPENDPSCLAMENWIEWLQPFYQITSDPNIKNNHWVKMGEEGKIPARPPDELMMDALHNGLTSLGDTPVAYFPELISWLPTAKVILTLRDPEKWWKSRVEHHAGDLMCAEKMWEKVAHPFSISDCFRLGGNEGIVNIKNFPKRVGIEGFIRYNKWVVSVVPKDRLFRFCPWDCRDRHCSEDGSTAYFTQKMLTFIKERCPPPCKGGSSHALGGIVKRRPMP